LNSAPSEEPTLLNDATVNSQDISVTTFDESTQPITAIAQTGVPSESVDELSSLKRFLAKPRFLKKGTIKDLASDYLTPIDFSSFFSLIEIVTKIFNYTGMRFTMCAKLTLNVTPFDSGCVVLSYTPPF
jgi:hypothetical protein